MEEKYEWANKANSDIQYESAYYRAYSANDDRPGSETDVPKLKHAFWSFLQAYQQIRFYHGAWVADSGKKGQGNKIVDNWKGQFLTSDEIKAWDLMNTIRTADTHDKPVLPNINVQIVRFVAGGAMLMAGGHYLGAGQKEVKINIQGIEHDLIWLSSTALLLLRRFIDTFDQVVESAA